MDSGQQFLHDTRYASGMSDESSDQQKGLPQPPLELPFDDSMPIIDLPDPKTLVIPSIDLRTAIDRRHSIRLYRDEALTLEELSFLLWCTQGVKAVTKRPCTLRTVPSGGARHALSLIHISEPTRLGMISYAVFCLKKKKTNTRRK